MFIKSDFASGFLGFIGKAGNVDGSLGVSTFYPKLARRFINAATRTMTYWCSLHRMLLGYLLSIQCNPLRHLLIPLKRSLPSF